MNVYEAGAQQNERELEQFIAILQRENVRSYLEIGSKVGGSLWKIANALPVGSRIVSVDLPWGDKTTLPHLVSCCDTLRGKGYNVTLIVGDSTEDAIIADVERHAPFDACFVDANHTLPYVTKDWENYGPLCRIVAFHDISFYREHMPEGRLPIDVPAFWNSIKNNYRHAEIQLEKTDNGIGVLWR